MDAKTYNDIIDNLFNEHTATAIQNSSFSLSKDDYLQYLKNQKELSANLKKYATPVFDEILSKNGYITDTSNY